MIPTAEVPLTAMRGGEILDAGELPLQVRRRHALLSQGGRRRG